MTTKNVVTIFFKPKCGQNVTKPLWPKIKTLMYQGFDPVDNTIAVVVVELKLLSIYDLVDDNIPVMARVFGHCVSICFRAKIYNLWSPTWSRCQREKTPVILRSPSFLLLSS